MMRVTPGPASGHLAGLVAAGLLAWLAAHAPSLAGEPDGPTRPGRLVIAGGAVQPDNSEVWSAFLEGLPDRDHDTIAVIASASAEPVSAFEGVRKTLARYGVEPGRVFLVRAATEDDPATPEDESLWVAGGSDEAEVGRVRSAGGIWFTGGDQARTARVLDAGSDAGTPLLEVLHERHRSGAVIGGTSAGAAIQSRTMILRGDSLTALLDPVADAADASRMEGGALVLGTGAGFFPFGVVDQHFDRQARLGRLARSVSLAPGAAKGFGIDEDTALVVDMATGRGTVAGRGSVTILIGDEQTRPGPGAGAFRIDDLSLSLATAGDRIDLMTGAVEPASYKSTDTLASPHYDHVVTSGGGIALPNFRLEDVLGIDLVDNGPTRSLDRWTFSADGRAVLYRFREEPGTRARGGQDPSGRHRYAISGLRFSIVPGHVRLDVSDEE
jgi:cyanophycinase